MEAKWSYESMAIVSKAILKTAIAELLLPEANAAIVINEYVEISKMYGSIEDYKYIHALLGAIIKLLMSESDILKL